MAAYADGIHPGKDLGWREIELTRDWVAKYTGSIDDRNPWYDDDSPFGGPVAPAAVFNYEMELFPGWHPPDLRGRILQTDQVWEFRKPMRVGQTIRLRGRVHDRYVKRGREYIAMESTAWDEEDELLCRAITTHCWPVQEQVASDDDSGASG